MEEFRKREARVITRFDGRGIDIHGISGGQLRHPSRRNSTFSASVIRPHGRKGVAIISLRRVTEEEATISDVEESPRN